MKKIICLEKEKEHLTVCISTVLFSNVGYKTAVGLDCWTNAMNYKPVTLKCKRT